MTDNIRTEIHDNLRVASHLIDNAASLIRAADVGPVDRNVLRLGRALVEISDVLQALYATTSGLRSDQAAATRMEVEANVLLQSSAVESLNFEQARCIDEAVKSYSDFIHRVRSLRHRRLARQEIERLLQL